MIAAISGRADLRGQVALITGAAGGIGSVVAKVLAREGAAVAVTARELTAAERVASEIDSRGCRSLPIALDVTDRASVEGAVDRTLRELGRIDIAVSSAGVVSKTPLWEITESDWETIHEVNLKGTFHLLRAVFPTMAAARYGKIVCLGSIAGEQGGIVSGPHYAAAKAGVHAMVKWLAKAGAPQGVYVNAIAPGPVLTPMWVGVNDGVPVDDPELAPLRRIGRPEDIAEAVLFLASQMSNWITGIVLDVNGGALMR